MTSNSSVDQFIGDLYKVFWVAWVQIKHLSTPVDSRWRRPASCIRFSHLVADLQSKSCSYIDALSDVIKVSHFLGVAEVVFGSGCFRIVNFDGNRLLKWVISIEDGTTEHCASGDFPYPSALRKFSITLSHVQAFPGHFTDLGMPNRVHSRCTIFLDVDVFLSLLSSTFLHSWCTIFRDVDAFLALLSLHIYILRCSASACAGSGLFSLCVLRIVSSNLLDFFVRVFVTRLVFVVVAMCTLCKCILYEILSKIGPFLSTVCPLCTIL